MCASASCRVRGSCGDWLPLVWDCLSGQGYVNIAADGASLRGNRADGSILVKLFPAPDGETDVIVTADVENGREN